jgi:hypothetical protein
VNVPRAEPACSHASLPSFLTSAQCRHAQPGSRGPSVITEAAEQRQRPGQVICPIRILPDQATRVATIAQRHSQAALISEIGVDFHNLAKQRKSFLALAVISAHDRQLPQRSRLPAPVR